MALVQLDKILPKQIISPVSTPPALRVTLEHIFGDISAGLWLVGGTALAGYYAEHRRSDDLDLFAMDEFSHQATIRSLHTLKKKGAQFSSERQTPNYYRAEVQFMNHRFTCDIVLDEFLHKNGTAHRVSSGIWVASLKSILAMKFSCLISRCSEKDLFDLDWIIAHCSPIPISQLVELGAIFDGGLTVETLLISLHGSKLRQEACNFLLPNATATAEETYRKIINLQKQLVRDLLSYEKTLQYPPEVESLAKAVKD